VTRNEVVLAAKRSGFTKILTAGGVISLDEWTPYGSGKEGDRPNRPVTFDLILGETPCIQDAYDPLAHILPDRAQALGIWRLGR
jgi:hypothetical protein